MPETYKEVVMKDCFGTIYPDLTQFKFGKMLHGKVFRIMVDTIGPGHRDRQLHCDTEAWAECQSCDNFRSCFDFSTGKLLMQKVLMDT